MKGNTATQQNQAIETKTQIFDFKTMPVQVLEKPVMQFQQQMVNTSFTMQKEFPVTSFLELVPPIRLQL